MHIENGLLYSFSVQSIKPRKPVQSLHVTLVLMYNTGYTLDGYIYEANSHNPAAMYLYEYVLKVLHKGQNYLKSVNLC